MKGVGRGLAVGADLCLS